MSSSSEKWNIESIFPVWTVSVNSFSCDYDKQITQWWLMLLVKGVFNCMRWDNFCVWSLTVSAQCFVGTDIVLQWAWMCTMYIVIETSYLSLYNIGVNCGIERESVYTSVFGSCFPKARYFSDTGYKYEWIKWHCYCRRFERYRSTVDSTTTSITPVY